MPLEKSMEVMKIAQNAERDGQYSGSTFFGFLDYQTSSCTRRNKYIVDIRKASAGVISEVAACISQSKALGVAFLQDHVM